jgi:hypothetical protein
VSHITTATRFRLSASQMFIVWRGLDLVIGSYVARQTKGGLRREYPFQLYPPPFGFSRGTFDRNFMDEIIGLWKRLKPKAKTGGRVQLDAIELRASMFAIRANVDSVRKLRHSLRRLKIEEKARFGIDDVSFDQLKTKSQRVIHTLERHMKRANRNLLRAVARNAYALLMNAWKMHLRWMWLHIAYFKPLLPVVSHRRIRQQRDLDELMKMTRYGLERQGYQSPDDIELRRMMRLYVSSARRGRQGERTAAFLLGYKNHAIAHWFLADFVLRRLDLEESPE